MGLVDKIKAYVKAFRAAPRTVAQRSAPRIQERLRADATTRRGNVPTFAPGPKGHPSGDIPITVTAVGDGIQVNAPDWVMRKAAELGQPATWGAIVAQEAKRGDLVK